MCTISATSHSAQGAKFSIGLNHSDVDNLMKELSRVTKGEFTFDLIEEVTSAAPKVDSSGKKGKKGKD